MRSTNVYGWSNVSCGKSICIDELHIEVAMIVSGVKILLCGESMKYVRLILLYGSVRT